MPARKKISKAAAPQKPAGRGRRAFFTTFKWCRIAVLLLVLISIVLGLFLHQVGLPVSFQRRIIERAEVLGWDLEFSRLRFRWYDGLVAENISLSRTNDPASPHLFVDTAELVPGLKSLRPLEFRIEAARLSGGRLIWPVAGSNQPVRTFALNDVRGEVFFKPNDEWELRALDAVSMGTRLHIRGDLTNASRVREWKLPKRDRVTPEEEREFWNRLLRAGQELRFDAPPDVSAIFAFDARDLRSLMTTLKIVVPGVASPWGKCRDVRLGATLRSPPGSNALVHSELRINVADAVTRWGAGTNLELRIKLDPSFTHLVPTNASFALRAQSADTPWAKADFLALRMQCQPASTNADLRETRIELGADRIRNEWGEARQIAVTGQLRHSATNLLPAGLDAEVYLAAPHGRWATSDWAKVNLRAELPDATRFRRSQTNLLWDRLADVPFHTVTTLSNTRLWRLNFDSVQVTNRWHASRLQTELSARLLEETIKATGHLDPASRILAWSTSGGFFPRKLSPLVETNVQPWLLAHEAADPLRLEANGTFILPAWTNRQPDWRKEALPTLAISGFLSGGNGAYRGVSYDSARALFTMTNLVLHAPEVRIGRPEGVLDADFSGDGNTGAFRCRLRSTIDPKGLDPLVHKQGEEDVLDLFKFGQPPRFDGVFTGNWRDWNRLLMDADVAVTNTSFRGESVNSVSARLILTNNFLSILRPLVLRDGERGQADGIGIELRKPRLFLTNATGRITPHVITRAIGPVVHAAVAPYIFDVAPQARVTGSIPLGKSDGTEDLHFEIDGGPFHWNLFNFDQVRATVHWRGETVAVTNMQGRWCGGDVSGWVFLDFSPTNTDLASFYTYVQGASLKSIARELQPNRTSRVDGALSGELAITRAELNDDRSWQGYGQAHLTNGLIWDIPLFGVFSPVLNAFLPGLGNSRAKHASLAYGITNSIISTRDMEIHANLMRMQFRGSVDFGQNVDGRMEAELLRDMPAIGFVISKVLWPVTKLFEYKVTGTLAVPKTEQLFLISKVLLFPFQPIKTLKDIFAEPEKKPPAPAPSAENKPPASPP